MPELPEIEATLRRSPEFRERVVRHTGSSTVALFAVFDSGEGERLQLAGTGTLVALGGSHYILTAAHVWEEVLGKADKIGITLREGVDHRFLMDVETMVPFGPARPSTWNEWGPDIVFLRVPPAHVGTINAFRVFYHLTIDQERPLDSDHLETWVLMGTPQALGTFTETHAGVEINGFFTEVDAPCQTRGDFDYFDLAVDTSSPGIPGSFGGVSGGGLWKVMIYYSSLMGNIDSVASLKGVAFHQSTIDNGRRTIRCHGPESIRIAMRCL